MKQRKTAHSRWSALRVLAYCLLLGLLLLTQPICLSAVRLAWDDANNPPGTVTGYRIYWGEQPNTYLTSQDVGLVLEAEVPIPYNSYIVATAYNDHGESAYSDYLYYTDSGFIYPPTAGNLVITVAALQDTGMKLGVDYDFQELPDGNILYIFKHLAPSQRVRLEY